MVLKFPHSFAASWLQVSLFILLSSLTTRPLRAQTVDAVQLPSGNSPTRLEIPPPQDIQPPSAPPSPPPQPPAPLPPPSDLFRPSNPVTTPNEQIPSVSETLTVKRFEVLGSTVFSREELAKVLAPFTNKPIAFAQLLQARDAISELYIKKGYITSGAYIPPQTLTSGVVKIQVVEG
ncbi:MAG: ShlB/FhaC/HecB family hemolysin secretion/activation protein, partial [Tolypothrix carrinoi HA7290-LM1]|nr:ShlB/FhaC/HecB family hemolysin secretion/activation protein [Tolypothrix carrinoi HA7290-LM1]